MRIMDGEVPVGAALFDGSGTLVMSAANTVQLYDDPTGHAELNILRNLGVSGLRELRGQATLAVTLEPCPMCAWAIKCAGIARLIFGAYNPYYGAAGSYLDLLRDGRSGRSVEVIPGELMEECSRLLNDTFLKLRDNSEW